jgi:hypothetical protein
LRKKVGTLIAIVDRAEVKGGFEERRGIWIVKTFVFARRVLEGI